MVELKVFKKFMLNWSIYKTWNEGLINGRKKREFKPRDYIYASEIGKSYIDVFLTLKGEKPSNDFSLTTMRKFDAGMIWEKIIEIVLKRMGILKETQKNCQYQIENNLPVFGRLDFLAGGFVDKEKANYKLDKIKDLLPENVYEVSKKIIEQLAGRELKEIILELKSISSFMFDKYETSGQANHNHRLQLIHYLLSLNKDEGHIIYISKDDARLLEIGVFNPSFVNDEYKKWVVEFSNYFKNNELPPKEKEIIFDEEWGKFTINWRVMYSSYLTKIYGYKNQEEVRELFTPLVESWNRVLSRVKNEKDLTKDNLKKIKEMEKLGYQFEKIKSLIK